MSEGDGRVAGDLPVVDADHAADLVEPGDGVAVSGFGSVGYPKAVPLVLAEDDRDLELTVISGGSVGEEIDDAMMTAGQIARRYPYQKTEAARERADAGDLAFHDRHVSRLADEVVYGHLGNVDIAMVEATAVGEDWFVPTTSIGQTPAYVQAADRVVVEVNHAQPRSLEALHDVYRPGTPPNREPVPLTDPGERLADAKVRFDSDKLAAVVETDRRDSTYSFRDPTTADETIAENLVEFLEDETADHPVLSEAVRLQFGVGSLGNALMSAFADADFGDVPVSYYGEVIQDGLLDMLDDGFLECASATSLALSEEGQDRLFENVERYAEDVVLRPADVSNGGELVSRLGIVAVNSALEVDLYGNVNSTHVGGTHVMNGVGGSGDFSRHAALPVIALPSTAKGGDLSRVVPKVPHVDHTEHDVSIIVTEHGVADLRGLDPRERADVILENCADPAYRDDLRAYLDDAGSGHIPQDLHAAADWR